MSWAAEQASRHLSLSSSVFCKEPNWLGDVHDRKPGAKVPLLTWKDTSASELRLVFFCAAPQSMEGKSPIIGRTSFSLPRHSTPPGAPKKELPNKKTKTFYNLTSFILNQIYRGRILFANKLTQQKTGKKPSGGDQLCQLETLKWLISKTWPSLWTPLQGSPSESHATSCASAKPRKLFSEHGHSMGAKNKKDVKDYGTMGVSGQAKLLVVWVGEILKLGTLNHLRIVWAHMAQLYAQSPKRETSPLSLSDPS